MTERKGFHGPGLETKGGGYHGGPKRWTGRGPAPARHVPWPEIFKHHISLCEGHLKMVDMVRKHTVEGTGNWRTIMACVERTRDMLIEVKRISRSFVPPPGQREQVPLGSSSASMYPGYSPADHEYGAAAEEYGRAAAAARAKGIDITHPEVEYQIGQAKGLKRKTLVGIREAKAAKEAPGLSGSGSRSDGAARKGSTKPAATNGAADKENTHQATPIQEATPGDEQPAFFIDTNPTPVNLPGISNQAMKRSAPVPEPVEGKKHKKAKNNHDGELPKGEDGQTVEFEDISGEVDARMKEKEEKRKRKEEKKRKHLSEGDSATVANIPNAAGEVEKPKMKKSKKSDDEALADRTASKKRAREDDGETEDEDGKKNKKRRKGKEAVEAT